jgi:hypothetical protein
MCNIFYVPVDRSKSHTESTSFYQRSRSERLRPHLFRFRQKFDLGRCTSPLSFAMDEITARSRSYQLEMFERSMQENIIVAVVKIPEHKVPH